VPQLLLASRSPQRRALLAGLGVAFTVAPADVLERDRGEPVELAGDNALAKARAVAASAGPGAWVLGVDTVVAVDGVPYGKPTDRAGARRTLERLSGRTHQVLSGLALLPGRAPPRLHVERADVRFRALGPALVDWYLDCQEWRERAGGYAIQGRGAALVREIRGDPTTVIGLPVGALLDLVPGLLAG